LFKFYILILFIILSNTAVANQTSITCLGKGDYARLTTYNDKRYKIEIEQEIIFDEKGLIFTNINLIGSMVGKGVEQEISFNRGIKGINYEIMDMTINKNKIYSRIYLLDRLRNGNTMRRGQVQFNVSRTTGKYEFYSDYSISSIDDENYESGNHVYWLNGDCKKTNKVFWY